MLTKPFVYVAAWHALCPALRQQYSRILLTKATLRVVILCALVFRCLFLTHANVMSSLLLVKCALLGRNAQSGVELELARASERYGVLS